MKFWHRHSKSTGRVSRFSRRRKIIIALTLATVFVVGGIFLVIRNLNSPAVGTIAPTPPPPASASPTTPEPINYSDKYISFTYPGNLEILPSQKGTNYLDVVNLYSNKTDHNNEKLAISILRESQANDPGITYRRNHPELYKEQAKATDVLIFTKSTNGNEKTVYITHGDLLASVSLTVPGDKDLSSDFDMILNSIKWK